MDHLRKARFPLLISVLHLQQHLMDNELQEKTVSRRLNVSFHDCEGDTQDGVEREVAEDILVLENLLESLDASAGGNGPVATMLKEMVDGSN
jgi:hypothetical protein